MIQGHMVIPNPTAISNYMPRSRESRNVLTSDIFHGSLMGSWNAGRYRRCGSHSIIEAATMPTAVNSVDANKAAAMTMRPRDPARSCVWK